LNLIFHFGQNELYGLAYRTDYDLGRHMESSKVSLEYLDEEQSTPGQPAVRFVPHCVEPSFGLDRTVLAVLSDAFTEDELGGEARTYLKFAPSVAPVKVAVFPLLKNKPVLVEKARENLSMLRKRNYRSSFLMTMVILVNVIVDKMKLVHHSV